MEKNKNSLIKKAIYFAGEKHDGQYRKGTKTPYFVHPILVAVEIHKYTKDEKMLVAAILHDTLEDCAEVTVKLLKEIFGEKIAKIVSEVSLFNKRIKFKTWRDRKLHFLKKIKKASKEALLLVAADKITNMNAYFETVKTYGPDSKKLKDFGGSLADYFWYYENILEIIKTKLDKNAIVKEYEKILKYYKLVLLKTKPKH